MAEVIIYTKTYCPYCVRAKALLDKKSVKYTEINIQNEPQRRDEMIKRANGGYTVPQIFINDQHIGGCDDMMALEHADRLDALLEN
ncbi:glutaredoxin 3 [Algicola sagamiensis]|uniref:glutaredoxin 3 n=1 Tax=Algicola sagamiensis TaxID=163869 RepID=UPI00037D71EC|nr:glutaredoxin 3 [Algicola sagamiensis]